MRTIKQIAIQKKQEYDIAYHEWSKLNPGKVMNGLSSKSLGADLASHCESKEELETLLRVYQRKAHVMEGTHGFNFVTTAFGEILNDYNNE